MTTASLAAAKSKDFNITRLKSFISTTEGLEHFCQGFDIHESPETTAAIKQLLLTDLRAKLAAEQAEFAAL